MPALHGTPDIETIQCAEEGCTVTVYPGPETRCEGGCDEYYCYEHCSDQCACRDDGSGQYVEDLPGYYCKVCHESYHEPVEYE